MKRGEKESYSSWRKIWCLCGRCVGRKILVWKVCGRARDLCGSCVGGIWLVWKLCRGENEV